MLDTVDNDSKTVISRQRSLAIAKILNVLSVCNDNRSRAAEMLGVSKRTLNHQMNKLTSDFCAVGRKLAAPIQS
ncbi:MAG TPA: hypothetical protein ENI67_05165 [Gammaproteobacteria bacterium]|nr:hypothetical protein [Gammaproteobacteria bacterium]